MLKPHLCLFCLIIGLAFQSNRRANQELDGNLYPVVEHLKKLDTAGVRVYFHDPESNAVVFESGPFNETLMLGIWHNAMWHVTPVFNRSQVQDFSAHYIGRFKGLWSLGVDSAGLIDFDQQGNPELFLRLHCSKSYNVGPNHPSFIENIYVETLWNLDSITCYFTLLTMYDYEPIADSEHSALPERREHALTWQDLKVRHQITQIKYTRGDTTNQIGWPTKDTVGSEVHFYRIESNRLIPE